MSSLDFFLELLDQNLQVNAQYRLQPYLPYHIASYSVPNYNAYSEWTQKFRSLWNQEKEEQVTMLLILNYISEK